MGGYVKGAILIIVVLFLITFGVKNSDIVLVKYHGMDPVGVPLYGLIFLSVLIGVFIGMLMGLRGRWELKRSLRRMERENRAVEAPESQEVPAGDADQTSSKD